MALPKPSVPVYELTVPSTGKAIKYRPFLVREEKVLLIALESQDEKQILNAITNILKGCIQTRGIKVEELAIFDIEYIFLKIRSKSVGEIVSMKVTCLDDNTTTVDYELNLDDVEVQKPEGHHNKIDLEGGMGLVMRYPGINEFVSTQMVDKDLTTEEVFNTVVASVHQIYTSDEVYESKTTPKKEIEEFLDSLTTKQFESIQDFFATMPKLSHSFKVINPNTGAESEYTIEGLTNFFG
jgi:hypothetical protein